MTKQGGDELKIGVATKVDEWLGAGEYEVLHCWTAGDTQMVVAKGTSRITKDALFFLRCFPLGDTYALSQTE